MDFVNSFDRVGFSATYKGYTDLMKQLHKMENDANFRHKMGLLKEIGADAHNSYKIAKKYREEYFKCTEIYQRWVSTGNELRFVVGDCCKVELGIDVEVIIPQLHLNVKK